MYRPFHKVSLSLMCFCAVVFAQPAHHQFNVIVPDGGTPLLRPTGVYVDPRTQELYVADTGNGRIVIFDRDGHFDFAFSVNPYMSAPKQMAADSLGRIFVLSEGPLSSLRIFDFDGRNLGSLPLRDPRTGDTLVLSSFLMDDRDQIIAMTIMPAHIYAFSTDGAPLFDFALFAGDDSAMRYQPILGDISLVNGDLMIPMPLEQAVARYSLDGKYVATFGLPGGGPKELSFPVAAASDGHGGILVLDRMRSTLLHYNNDGTTLDEFGGMGLSDGWFYLPAAIASRPDGICYVAQMYNNRVQAIRIESESPETGTGYAVQNEAKN